MRPHIHKFGGTSVADGARILDAASLALSSPRPTVVVVSALSGVTDSLVDWGDSSDETTRRSLAAALRRRHVEALSVMDRTSGGIVAAAAELDSVLARLQAPSGLTDGAEAVDARLSIGEDLSAILMREALVVRGATARVVDARDLIRTDGAFGRAHPLSAPTRAQVRERLAPLLDQGVVPVVPGFTGATADGRTTTLGRGGSDLSAAILGAALDADGVDVWTDVDGILTGDPRVVDAPRVIEELGFEEAVEIASFGAKVIHAGAVKYAVTHGVPLRIRNTFRPDLPGTSILPRTRHGEGHIAAIALKRGVALIEVRSHPTQLEYGFLANVFDVLGEHRVPVDLVATSHSSTAFTVDESEALNIVAAELETTAEVTVRPGLATLALVGRGLLDTPGTLSRVFSVVGTASVHLVSQASTVSASLVVDAADAPDLMRRLHHDLLDRVPTPSRRTST